MEKVEFTDKMKSMLKGMTDRYNLEVRSYLQACMDGMGLDNQIYIADLSTLSFVPKKELADKGAA